MCKCRYQAGCSQLEFIADRWTTNKAVTGNSPKLETTPNKLWSWTLKSGI